MLVLLRVELAAGGFWYAKYYFDQATRETQEANTAKNTRWPQVS
ncbi:hypothetical protein [Desulfallas thermosapovorans]|nr:hypothetical protein [Desulfallas thermosapovorans]